MVPFLKGTLTQFLSCNLNNQEEAWKACGRGSLQFQTITVTQLEKSSRVIPLRYHQGGLLGVTHVTLTKKIRVCFLLWPCEPLPDQKPHWCIFLFILHPILAFHLVSFVGLQGVKTRFYWPKRLAQPKTLDTLKKKKPLSPKRLLKKKIKNDLILFSSNFPIQHLKMCLNTGEQIAETIIYMTSITNKSHSLAKKIK